MALLNDARPLTPEPAHNVHTVMSGLETVLAALPPALMGLMLSAFLLGLVPLAKIVWGGPTPVRITNPIVIAYIAPSLVGMALIIGGLYGASQRLVRWSYTWATGAVLVVLLGLVILGDELPYLISPAVDLLIVLSLLGLLAVLASVGAWRSSKDAALVGLGFAGTFATTMTFFATAGPFWRFDIGLLSVPVGLAFALLIVNHLRGGAAAKTCSVAAAAMLNIALIWIYKAVIFSVEPPLADPDFHWGLLAIGWGGLLAPLALSWLLKMLRLASRR